MATTNSVLGAASSAGGAKSSGKIINKYIAGETINVERAVYLNQGEIFKANNSDVLESCSVIGVSKQAGLIGGEIEVVEFGELVTVQNWVINKPVFVTLDGQLTQTPPTTDILFSIGFATDTNSLYISPERELVLLD